MQIEAIKAYEVLDSRGHPTIEVCIKLKDGTTSTAQAPAGASKGKYEALEIRDEDNKRFFGKGLLKVKDIINNKIAKELIGKDVTKQIEIDKLLIDLDGTANKSNLGANSTIAISLAVCKAASSYLKLPLYKYIQNLQGLNHIEYILPIPLLNIINGGLHAQNELDIQEFMIIPVNFGSFFEAIRASSEVYYHLKNRLKNSGFLTNVGDEGGFAPNFKYTKQAIEYIIFAIQDAGYKEGRDIYLGLDVAASELYDEEKKIYKLDNKELDTSGMIDFYQDLIKNYPIISIEDGLSEEDFAGWERLTQSLLAINKNFQVVGDDLFVTNKSRLEQGIKENSANAILIKPNQIGTLTETLEVIKYAKENNYRCIISHRSGEVEDTIIADIAVGLSLPQIKTGAPARGERVAKYNRLIRIEEELGKYCNYCRFKI